MQKTAVVFVSILLALAAHAARAEVAIEGAWVRGTVPGQKATGAFMQIKSSESAALIGVETPAAAIAEIHEMRMDGNVVRMRAIKKLDLPAGRTVELKPGGYHVMLMDLKRPLKAGDSVPLKLKLEGKDKKVQELDVNAEVRDLAAGPAKH